MKHGTYSTYSNHGCRCDACRAANTAYHADYMRRLAGREPPVHGMNAYRNYACRCDVCKAAASAYYKRRRAEPTGDRLPGSTDPSG